MLRLATREDAAACQAIYAPYVRDTCISFELTPPTVEELAQRMDGSSDFAPWLVAELDGAVIGYAYGSRFRARAAYGWTLEVSVYVAGAAHRRGVARALYSALLEGARLQGFHAALGVVTLPNAPSVALHIAFGFRQVAHLKEVGFKRGAWHDVGWFQRELAPALASPPPVQPVSWLVGQPEWAAVLRAQRSSEQPLR